MNISDAVNSAALRAELNMNPIGVMSSVVNKANDILASDPTEGERRDLFRSLRHTFDANTRLVSMVDPNSIKSLELALY